MRVYPIPPIALEAMAAFRADLRGLCDFAETIRKPLSSSSHSKCHPHLAGRLKPIAADPRPDRGTVVDDEARGAIATLLETLRALGIRPAN